MPHLLFGGSFQAAVQGQNAKQSLLSHSAEEREIRIQKAQVIRITEQNTEVKETSHRESSAISRAVNSSLGFRMQDKKLLENRERTRPNSPDSPHELEWKQLMMHGHYLNSGVKLSIGQRLF